MTGTQQSTPARSFCFVLDRIDVDFPTPIEVIPGHFLQRADAGQLLEIKNRLQLYHTFMPGPTTRVYEIASDTQQQLPPERWLYWVINFHGPNHEIGDLQRAASLLQRSLQLDITFLKTHIGAGLSWSPGAVFHFFSQQSISALETRILTKIEIEETAQQFALLKEASVKWPSIHKTAIRFKNLAELSDHSEFKVIGYFSAIESLITHAPKPTDPTESLTRQVKSKMALLGRRFERPLVTAPYFGDAAHDKVWSHLYSYRSDIAHGNQPDFQGSLQVLKSRQNVTAFLREATKLVLLQALREPQLVSDLKNC